MKYTATALSALHIGAGRTLTPLDYLVTRDGVAVFDTAAFLAANPTREGILAFGDQPLGAEPMLEALLTPAEQAQAGFVLYSAPAPEFVRNRLRGEKPPAAGKAAPAAPAAPAAAKPVAPRAPRTDLRGGLGGKIALRLPNLPAAPTPAPAPAAATPAPTPAKTAARAAAPATPGSPAPAAATATAPKPERPERPLPPERRVGTFVKAPVGDGVYIPGSTIRGALRTSLLYWLLHEHPDIRHRFAEQLQRRMNDRTHSSRVAEEELDALLRVGRKDVLSALRLGDSEPLPAGKTLQVEQVRLYSPRTGDDGLPLPGQSAPAGRPGGPPGRGRDLRGGMGGGGGGAFGRGGLGGGPGSGGPGFQQKLEQIPPSLRGQPLYVEAVKPRTAFSGRVSLADTPGRGRPNWLPPITPTLLCKAANTLAKRVLEREYLQYSRAGADFARINAFYEELFNRVDRAAENTAHVSLGWGAGWHRITVGLILDEMADADGLDLFALRRKYALASHRLRSVFPKTRKLVMETPAAPRQPLGWVELKFE
jgi:CRISPR/Cas system CSM-associated protein Csm5 (group 7 of RAMP superfamily)